MVSALPKILTNTWVKASWEEYVAIADHPDSKIGLEKAKFYYDDSKMRVEQMTTGSAHGINHFLLSSIISLYGTLKDINFQPFDNASFRKEGEKDCQPDLALYIGEPIPEIPADNNPVDVDKYGPPALAIEISVSTLSDDLGPKRRLYERLNAQEYWIIDVGAAAVIAFSIKDGGSYEIRTSQVLPGLEIATIEEAIRRAAIDNVSVANRWLLQQFA